MLSLSAAGHSVTEVAELLGQTPHDACQLLVEAMCKLGARSKLEAIVIAKNHRMIDTGATYGTPIPAVAGASGIHVEGHDRTLSLASGRRRAL